MADMNQLKELIADLEEDGAMDLLKSVMADGGSQAGEALTACQEGMKIVGDRFESGEYFLPDLIYAGDIMGNAVELLKPALAAGGTGQKGKMILCTVQNDLHDIGKNIVKSILEAAGFEVVDLGIDVAPEKIIETIQGENIKIVALSGVLTLALDSMKNTIEAIAAAGLRDSVKIIVGGNPVTEEACKYVGADDWAVSPQKTTDICTAWAMA